MVTKKRSLGTGLDALFGEDISTENTSETLTLPISKVEPRQDQPRNTFEQEALEELSESIKQYGIIQPITVRQLDNGYYQIIAGERRWRAAKLADLESVPVRILEADDRTVAEIALVENLQREDLNPVEEARGYQALMDEYDLTQEQIASAIGKSRPVIANSLRLLNLCPEVLDLIQDGSLSSGHGRTLAAVSDPEAQVTLATKMITNNMSVRSAEKLVKSYLKKSETRSISKESNEYAIDYAEEESKNLTAALSRKCTIIQKKRTGKIELEYYSDDDRERLIKALYTMGKDFGKENN